MRKCSLKGFTLLEVIIVIIIISVLTSLALPRYKKFIQQAYAAEAFSTMGVLKRAAERCILMGGGIYDNCILNSPYGTEINLLDVGDPGKSPNAHFRYEVKTMGHTGPEGGPDTIAVTAYRNTLDGGGGETDYLYMDFDIDGQQYCETDGIFEGMKCPWPRNW